MSVVSVSSRGRITLPAECRRALGIQAHDRVFVRVSGDTIVVKKAPDFFELAGMLPKGLPMEEERRRMAEGVAKRVMGKE